MLGTWEIVIIVLVVLLLFGGKKIPELMKGLGQGVRNFKDGINGKEDPKDNDALKGRDSHFSTENQDGKDVQKGRNDE
ncbi:MAG: twin-arginine translocase TatA/TatE family subunit [Bacteroidales bacterium]|nr:twin-arginine translocase TatA/TatE family subunit [Bacteroidales bacterium]